MIVAFAGKKGSGKSYYAHELCIRGFFKASFADQLKEAVKVIFGLSNDDVYNPDKKDTVIEKYNTTPRQLMQWLGTDILRKEFNKKFNYEGSIWVDNMKALIQKTSNSNIVIDDVRFQNEVDMIHSLGGIIIKIECDNEIKDTHESENQNVSYDYIIKNDKDNKKLTKSNIELLCSLINK